MDTTLFLFTIFIGFYYFIIKSTVIKHFSYNIFEHKYYKYIFTYIDNFKISNIFQEQVWISCKCKSCFFCFCYVFRDVGGRSVLTILTGYLNISKPLFNYIISNTIGDKW